MTEDEDPPLKLVAPWRWHWDLIRDLVLRCGATTLVAALLLWWSSFFAVPIALCIHLALHAWCTGPLPSPTEDLSPEPEEADQGPVFIQDTAHPNRWKVTHRERERSPEVQGDDGERMDSS